MVFSLIPYYYGILSDYFQQDTSIDNNTYTCLTFDTASHDKLDY